MARPGFLNDNEARAYPLVPVVPDMYIGGAPIFPVRLPHSALVDFGCVVGIDAEFDDRVHSVYLYSVSRAGAIFRFEFRSDAPGLAGYTLRFERTRVDPEFACEEAEAVTIAGSSGPTGPCPARDDPLWEGFLVTGMLDDLAAFFGPTDGGIIAGNDRPRVEPALIQNLARGYVRTLNLANEDRTRAAAPPDCPADSSESLGDPVAFDHQYRTIVNAECLLGPQVLREGYSCVIRQNPRDNSLTIAAALAAGAGQPCAEVPLADRERPPRDSKLLTGGPACDELVTGINGLTGGVLRLVPLQGVRIVAADDVPNRLIVDVDLHDLTICPPEQISETAPDTA
jgi:hypothetical protein